MQDLGVCNDSEREARGLRTQAPLDLLAIEKIVLAHKADLIDEAPPHKHRRTADIVDPALGRLRLR